MANAKPALSIIMGSMKNDDDDSGSSDELTQLAQDLIDAVGDKDAESVKQAIMAMYQACKAQDDKSDDSKKGDDQ
jgi:hypothetical protein